MAIGKKKDNELFIKECHEQGKFPDFSNLNYVNQNTLIDIICHKRDRFGLEHGSLTITPKQYLKLKCDCPKCAKPDLCYTTEEFVTKAKIVWGYNCDYSETEFKNMTTNVKIKCNVCKKTFEQKPYKHLGGEKRKPQGCPFCTGKYKDNESFISQLISIHGHKYGYELVDYNGADTPVTLICKKHGTFTLTPHKLLEGCGCQKCSKEETKNKRTKPQEDFIKQSLKLWGENKNDYSEVEYKSAKEKVKIRCLIHNYVFLQTPTNHLSRKEGCKYCAHGGAHGETPPRSKNINNVFYEETSFDSNVYINKNVGDVPQKYVDWTLDRDSVEMRGLIAVVDKEGISFLKEESLYSHTAFLKINDNKQNIPILIVEGNCFFRFKNENLNLVGSPRIVKGDFDCSGIGLQSFVGMPQYIQNTFNIKNNNFNDAAWEYCRDNINGEFSDYKIENNFFIKYGKELW